VPGYDVSVWWGFLGPAGMPPEIVAKLEADVKTALGDSSVQATLEKIGATPVGSTSKEFDAFMRAEAAKWEPVLKAANIRAQ
jgi:tripartite-type tricarboxylate transporter receptor subunit TctC